MINSIDGPILLRDAFGALLAYKLTLMLNYVERPIVCGVKVEYGVPFFDDLGAFEKAAVLHAVTTAVFNPESPVLSENAYHAAALAALENLAKTNIEQEIRLRFLTQKRYGVEGGTFRALTIMAFQSRYPTLPCPGVESIETLTFGKMTDRLFAEIRPRSYFLMADVPEPKCAELMKRSSVPEDYFDSPEDIKSAKVMSEEDRLELQRSLLADAKERCMSLLADWLQNERSELTAFVAGEPDVEKQIEITQAERN
jgi:hypothetical protein